MSVGCGAQDRMKYCKERWKISFVFYFIDIIGENEEVISECKGRVSELRGSRAIVRPLDRKLAIKINTKNSSLIFRTTYL